MSVCTEEREILKVGDFGVWMAFKEDGSGARCLCNEFEKESDAIAEANRLNEKNSQWCKEHGITRENFFVVIIND